MVPREQNGDQAFVDGLLVPREGDLEFVGVKVTSKLLQSLVGLLLASQPGGRVAGRLGRHTLEQVCLVLERWDADAL